MDDKIKLRLFINKKTSSSQRAVFNLHRICREESLLKNHYTLEIIDVTEKPKLAEDEKIIATPTLIREYSKPNRKIIGDLSNREKVLMSLNLKEFN